MERRVKLNSPIADFRNDAKKIAKSFGTPTYVVYEKTLKENYKRFYNSFKNRIIQKLIHKQMNTMKLFLTVMKRSFISTSLLDINSKQNFNSNSSNAK